MDGPTVATFPLSDGYSCHYRHYAPLGERRGLVVYLHGIQSHGGWYTASCEYLAAAGWEVIFLDRRGSGLNQQDRGDAPSYRRLVDDVAELVSCRPGRPFLVAVSWGGKLAVALEMLYPGLIAGMALLTPGLCPRVRPPFTQRLAIALARLVAPRRLFPIPLDDPELFTATPGGQAFIRDDPLALRRATARLLVSSAFLDRALSSAPEQVRAPALLMLAGRDRIIDNERTRAYFARFASADKEVIEYPEAHHTLELELDPTPAFADLVGWLGRHAPPAA
jgi:alpha-beta hydrolase superfamily lysophospholipase